MFKYKNEAELKAMTEAERDQYSTEKRAHEAAEAIKEAKEAAKTAVEEATKELKTTMETQKETIKTLEETVEKQGVKIVEMAKVTGDTKKESLEDIFKTVYDANVSGENHTVKEPFTIDTSKAAVSTDIMSTNTVNSTDFPTAGSTGIVPSGLQTMMAKFLGYFGYRSPTSKILDLVDVQPMESATLIVVNETYTGDAAITTECKLNPIVKMVFTTEEKSAEPVSAEWNTTTKLRRFFPALVNRMLQKFTELVNDKLPNVILEAVKLGATAFTPNVAFQISSTPNNYDALGAVIASIENLGLLPNGIVLNPIAWRNMKQEKTTTGEYTLSNGASITILQNGLDWGGTFIPIIKDPKIGVDEFIVGDLFATVKVGVDSMLMYFETDGRTDAQATTSLTGVSRNIRTHVIEKFFAVIIPAGSKIGIIKDTFSNVKTLITKP
jgi:hypothetical protein